MLLLDSLTLDLELHDLAVEVVEFFGLGVHL